MQVKIFDGTEVRAEKVSGTGAIYYVYWIDDAQKKYVQITRNVGGAGAGTGTFSSSLFAVDSLAIEGPLSGIDPVTGARDVSLDNNMRAFLKAIKLDIDRRRENGLEKKYF